MFHDVQCRSARAKNALLLWSAQIRGAIRYTQIMNNQKPPSLQWSRDDQKRHAEAQRAQQQAATAAVVQQPLPPVGLTVPVQPLPLPTQVQVQAQAALQERRALRSSSQYARTMIRDELQATLPEDGGESDDEDYVPDGSTSSSESFTSESDTSGDGTESDDDDDEYYG